MIGIRFYLEFDTPALKRKGQHSGNVIATIPDNRCPDGSVEAIGAVFFRPNSSVAGTSASREYLRLKCKRIPESMAREIHPELFKYLDSSEGLNGDVI